MCWKNPKMTVQKSVADEYEHFASSRNPTSPTSSGLRTRRIGQMIDIAHLTDRKPARAGRLCKVADAVQNQAACTKCIMLALGLLGAGATQISVRIGIQLVARRIFFSYLAQ